MSDTAVTSSPSPAFDHQPSPVESVRVREATIADAPALALVAAATFLEAFTWMLPGADIVAHCALHHTPAVFAQYLERPTTSALLLEALPGGAPVGYAMVTAPDLPSIDVQPDDTELKRIYIFSRFRRAPVAGAEGTPAQALLARSVALAQAAGKQRMLLGVHLGNTQALGFYRRNGFHDVGTRTFQVGTQTCCDLILARTL